MVERKVTYEELTTGYEFPPATLSLDKKLVTDYLNAVEDGNAIYDENKVVPPMAVAARAMIAMASAMVLPAGTIHVSQEVSFTNLAKVGEILTSRARVSRRVERGKLHMLTISIEVVNRDATPVTTGETSFILPYPA